MATKEIADSGHILNVTHKVTLICPLLFSPTNRMHKVENNVVKISLFVSPLATIGKAESVRKLQWEWSMFSEILSTFNFITFITSIINIL